MEVYTLKQAAHKAKMGTETLKHACEAGLLKAVKLPNRQWRIGEEALHKFVNEVGGDLNALLPRVTRSKGKRSQPEALRRAQANKKAAWVTTVSQKQEI